VGKVRLSKSPAAKISKLKKKTCTQNNSKPEVAKKENRNKNEKWSRGGFPKGSWIVSSS